MNLIRCIKADLYKLKHTSIVWIHLIIPILGAMAFLLYYSNSSWEAISKFSGYFEAIAIAFPLIIGLVSSMVIEQEEQGDFKELITSTTWRGTALISKLILLIIGGTVSIIIALAIFAVGFQCVLKQGTLPIKCYVQVGASLLLGNIFLYIIHTYLSLQLGKGASIGLGIIGSLISTIMITGLGDRVWRFIPWSWGVRLCDYRILKEIDISTYSLCAGEIKLGLINIISSTIAVIAIILFWFASWEGRKVVE